MTLRHLSVCCIPLVVGSVFWSVHLEAHDTRRLINGRGWLDGVARALEVRRVCPLW